MRWHCPISSDSWLGTHVIVYHQQLNPTLQSRQRGRTCPLSYDRHHPYICRLGRWYLYAFNTSRPIVTEAENTHTAHTSGRQASGDKSLRLPKSMPEYRTSCCSCFRYRQKTASVVRDSSLPELNSSWAGPKQFRFETTRCGGMGDNRVWFIEPADIPTTIEAQTRAFVSFWVCWSAKTVVGACWSHTYGGQLESEDTGWRDLWDSSG